MIGAKVALTLLAATGGAVAAGPVCGTCRSGAEPVQGVPAADRAADTASVRLHISGMTCGSCATTARLALQRLKGVYVATVSLEDSVGVVRYDPQQVTPPQIVAHLERMTGYRATVLNDRPSPGGTRQ